MNTFQAEHSSPWDRHVARMLSSHESSCDSACELADPNEIEYFLSNDLDILYNEELRSTSRSAFDLIKEQRKRDLLPVFFVPSEESCSYTKSFHSREDTSSLRSYHSTDYASESLGHHNEEDFEANITKKARIEPALDEDSIFLRDTTSLKEKKDLPDVLFAHDSSAFVPFGSVKKLHSFVDEYQKGLDALTKCIERTKETRSKVAMIKHAYVKQQTSNEKCAILTSKIFLDELNLGANRTSNNREFKHTDVMTEDLIGKDIHLFRNNFHQRSTHSISSLETEDSTESK